METIKSFFKHEPVLVVAALAAAVSCFFVPPDSAYLGYLDLRTLALLYCLMTVVAGLRQAGFFECLAHTLFCRINSVRSMGILLVLLCFFSAMVITNDVALLTFVPFAVVVLGMADRKKDLIFIVVLQTVAANLGSMLTPVGNPQNLYLYSCYDLRLADFVQITFPIWLCSLILVTAACFVLPREPLSMFLGEKPALEKRRFWTNIALFAVCLLVVLRVVPWPAMLLAVLAVLLILDRKTLVKADFMLLLTFVAFFVFSGNLARISAVDALLRRLLDGREYLTSLAASQVISNVPAALLLSGFTGQYKALLLGVNIGGLGTPIASLASLISMKLYAHSAHAHTGRYLGVFLGINVLMLVILSVVRGVL